MPKGIYFRTEEAKRNIGLSKKGISSWNKGKKLHYQVWNKNIAFTQMKGNTYAKGNKPNSTSFKKNNRASIKTEFKKGQMSIKQTGESNSNWKGGLTRIQKLELSAGRPKPNYCEICGFSGVICFDHCHKTGRFRGWICSKCNFALGNARDNPEILIALSNYLKK